jgi:hypothetical protein
MRTTPLQGSAAPVPLFAASPVSASVSASSGPLLKVGAVLEAPMLPLLSTAGQLLRWASPMLLRMLLLPGSYFCRTWMHADRRSSRSDMGWMRS